MKIFSYNSFFLLKCKNNLFQDAIEKKSFTRVLELKKGNLEEGFKNSKHILEGEIHMGGQEHFYMETHATIAIPKETGEIELIR